VILVDDEPYAVQGPADQTVREVAQAVCLTAGDRGRRMVVAVHCDGEAVAERDLESVLSTPASRYARLDLHTQPIGAMVEATLTQTLERLEEAHGLRTRAADHLSEGNRPGAMQSLQAFLEAWRQIQESMLVSAEALGLDLETLRSDDGCQLPELLGLMKTHLNELKSAMEHQDDVVVGDILRYELDDLLTRWAGLLEKLREQSGTTA
jgi:hypothetical protein